MHSGILFLGIIQLIAAFCMMGKHELNEQEKAKRKKRTGQSKNIA